jgi:hypothetical protein
VVSKKIEYFFVVFTLHKYLKMANEVRAYAFGKHEKEYEWKRDVPHDEYSLKYCGDFVFQRSISKTTSKTMDKLWAHFHKNKNYPKYYIGIAKKVAICKCPITGEVEWYNGERCLTVRNPEVGSTVTVTVKINNKIYTRDFIFMGWLDRTIHEWSMETGKTFQLEDAFVNELFAEEKRYLKIPC